MYIYCSCCLDRQSIKPIHSQIPLPHSAQESFFNTIAHGIVQGFIIKDLFLEFLRNKVMPHSHPYDLTNPLSNLGLIMDNFFYSRER